MRMFAGLCALALVLACPQAAPARSYTVEDLLATEALGQVQIDPRGRWAVVERQRPWGEISDYSYGGLTPMLLSELWIADLKADGPLVRLAPSAPDTGYFAGPISPDGAEVMVYRLRGAQLDAGVARFKDRTIAWTGRTPELPVFGRAAQWAGDGRLLLLTTGAGRLPYHLASRRTVQDELPDRWRQAAQGRMASVSAIGSGRFLDWRPRAQLGALAAIDPSTGTTRDLAAGEFIDLEIAPSGRWAALIERAGDIQPPPDEPMRVASPTRELRLVLVDLTSGHVTRPALPAPMATGLLSWSRDERLLIALAPNAATRRLAVVRAARGTSQVLTTSRPLALTRNLEGSVYPRAAWRGPTPIMQLAAPDGRAEWRTASGAQVLAPGENATPPAPGTRLRVNPPLPAHEDGRHLPARPPGGEVLAAGGGQQLLRTTTAQGVTVLTRASSKGQTALATLNAHLGEVAPARIEPVRHPGPNGEPLVSWLYRPPTGTPRGLVVIPYRGAVYPSPPGIYGPGVINTYRNAQILVGAGYAVLAPSLPYTAGAIGPTGGIAADILSAVDAAEAQGRLGPSRLALYGHSFGALGAVAAASQSDRFASVISAAGVQDEVASWGEFVLHNWVRPEDGLSSPLSAGKVESGQAGLAIPPWAAPERYRQASNIFAADQITAPVLLIHGDLDDIRATQSHALFTALYRQRKDAALLTYWGEGHTFASPANIRDLYGRIVDWLDLTLDRPAPSAAPRLPPSERSAPDTPRPARSDAQASARPRTEPGR
jgi:dipeptidyl aminopeptidase/acylaminoacyl peptidase